MPRKIRELIRDLTRAGFTNTGGKGSHRVFKHAKGVSTTVSGQEGGDAKPYQEKDVAEAIKKAKE